jgi:molecular chaperone Hsp33
MQASSDRVVRAMTIDGAFRVIAVIATDTANAACAAQGLSTEPAARLAELITCAVIVRETTQPSRRVQLVRRDRHGGVMVADSLPDGSSRGIINPGRREAKNEIDAENEGRPDGEAEGEHLLQVNYTLPNGLLHQGVVAVAANADIGTALMQYMHTSEQTVAMVAVSAVGSRSAAAGDGSRQLAQVGGYLIQVLPEATREGLAILTEKLGRLPPIDALVSEAGDDPRGIIQRVLEGFPFAELADSQVVFGCTCSEARVIMGILSLGSDEVAEMEAGVPLEVRCDACGTRYMIEPSSIRAMRELRARGELPS